MVWLLDEGVPAQVSTSSLDHASRVARDKPWSTLCKKSHGIPSSPRAAAVAKFRLLTGHDCLCAHLFRFNLVTSPICVLCDTGQDMTAAHLDECSALNDLNCIISADISTELSGNIAAHQKRYAERYRSSVPALIFRLIHWVDGVDPDKLDLTRFFATRGLLATDHVILNHGQVTWTTPELEPPLLTTTPHQREDVSALDRFNVHRREDNFRRDLTLHSAKLEIKRIFRESFRLTASRVARDKPWSTLCKKSHGIPSSPRAATVAKFRLLTGHDCLCAHLFRFNLVTSPICVLCDTGKDTTAAHLDECSALNDLNCIVKSYTRAFGDGLRNFEPWSCNVGDNPFPLPGSNPAATGDLRRRGGRLVHVKYVAQNPPFGMVRSLGEDCASSDAALVTSPTFNIMKSVSSSPLLLP
ncbi:uncharacterized protein TNCV_3001371 [Trichonephila clavipes]|nr:uncharacterized protein TNCV_3001371 [Trichonephila clavipes]